MTTLKPVPVVAHPIARGRKGSAFLKLLDTTDHELIGIMYLATSFGFFMIGGVMAPLMRGELARPGPGTRNAGVPSPAGWRKRGGAGLLYVATRKDAERYACNGS
ncbi:hypothetical protein SK803_03050 [Lentzea sp. BCCO 10_0856]|uniref:Uncharacterized protein n=1 Tax=Lentzea miocenica TaxID=3095431 RepID=A0ABU4STT2_9PSEU|nr:hypothetical protein [Lentzea sp. BCCO 10_0856]MDX8029168.1 hypothetical protein [Lentzea sp. BCCO 10_0856]